MRSRLPPLELLTYQIHMPLPLYGLAGPPPLPPVDVPPPVAAPPSAVSMMAPAVSAAARIVTPTRARDLRRERARLAGRLPAGPTVILGACICAPAAKQGPLASLALGK